MKGPCGVFAGGYGVGSDARNMLDLDDTPMETWTAGETAEVSWSITANHGGTGRHAVKTTTTPPAFS